MKKHGFTVRADGRLQTAIVDSKTGKRIYFYGKTAHELKQKIFEYNQRADAGPLFDDVAAAWWEEAEPELALQSRRGYLRACSKAREQFKDIYIKEIQAKDVTAYLKTLARQYSSQKTIDKYRLVINLIFKYAIENGDIEYNPASAAKAPKGLQKAKRKAAAPEDEQIIKERSDLWLFPFFAIYTGMRKGEILALKWKDIDFENDLINVYKSVEHDGNKPGIKGTKTKAGTRTVPLLAPLKDKLLEIRAKNQEEYIFSADGSEPLTERRYNTLFNKYREATGITCTAHQLRHSFATIAFENDVDPKTVQEILGHKQLSTTMDIYTEFRSKRLKQITAELNQKFK